VTDALLPMEFCGSAGVAMSRAPATAANHWYEGIRVARFI
jgi:hypothetical protein